MKSFIFSLVLLLSIQSFAALNIRPGLWNVEMKLKSGNKIVNPAEEMEKSMKGMSHKNKQKMQVALNRLKAHNGMMQVCYTEDALRKSQNLDSEEAEKCDTKIKKETKSEIVSEFKCVNGVKGNSKWIAKDKEHYQGSVNSISAEGEKSQLDYKGEFVSVDCGNVKPVNL